MTVYADTTHCCCTDVLHCVCAGMLTHIHALCECVCVRFTCLPLVWVGQSRMTTPLARPELVFETLLASAGSVRHHTGSAASGWPGRTGLCQTSSAPVCHNHTLFNLGSVLKFSGIFKSGEDRRFCSMHS